MWKARRLDARGTSRRLQLAAESCKAERSPPALHKCTGCDVDDARARHPEREIPAFSAEPTLLACSQLPPPLLAGNRSARGGRDADRSRLCPKLPPMIYGMPGFVLPLMHHLVQQRVQRLLPSVPSDVSPPDH